MSLVHRYEQCIGIPLFKSKRRYVEIWYCPRGYKIKEHSHPNERIELMYIFGKTTFFRREKKDQKEQSFTPKWYHCFRTFSVPYGFLHRFEVSNLPLIFINFSKFFPGYEPVSASVDFELK